MRAPSALVVLASLAVIAAAEPAADPTRDARERMVREQIEARGVSEPRLLAALRAVPRHEFVPEERRSEAYLDRPVPIGLGQTMSQPYVVAVMTELARVGPGDEVLEVGTGSGYQAAVLAACGAKVWTIEIVDALAKRAAADLARLGYGAVQVKSGDGFRGWPEVAPFDAILVTAAAPRVPEALLAQLEVGGRLVIPVGESDEIQSLQVHVRTEAGIEVRDYGAVRFVPMTGEIERAPD
jgi:protein-L-isoaspartate(D-aspartate) O-methyltransferase